LIRKLKSRPARHEAGRLLSARTASPVPSAGSGWHRIVGCYLGFGVAWILAFAVLLAIAGESPVSAFWLHLGDSAGLVTASSLVLFLLLKRFGGATGETKQAAPISDERYRSLFEHNPSSIYLLDTNGRFIDANPMLCDMVGLPLAKIIGQSWEPMAEPDSIDFVREQFRAALAGETRTYEAVGRRPDGTRFPVQITNVPRYADGRINGVYGIARDITVERTAQDRIAASEQRYRALFEHSPFAIVLTDPEAGTALDVNTATERMFGVSRDKLVGGRRTDFLDPDSPETRAFFERRRREGIATGILPVRRPDGSQFEAEVTATLYTDANGELRGVFIARDLSEERRQARQLRESEERFHALFEHSPDAILILEPKTGRNIDANPAAEALLGLGRAEILERRREDDTDTDDPAVIRFIEERQRTGLARAVVRMIRGDGCSFPADVTSAMYRDSEGRLTACNIIRDISEQQRQENLLREREERFRALFEHSPDAILDLEPASGRVFNANPAAQKLFGRSAEEFQSLQREALTDVEDPALAAFVADRNRRGHARAALTLLRSDGSRFPADVTSASYVASDGTEHAAVVIRDISEQRRLMRDLEAQQAALTELSETRRAVLDALPANIALLDESGVIRFVNEAWRRFAARNDYAGEDAGVGVNYLDVCDRAASRGGALAGRVAAAARDVIAGGRPGFDEEYDCHSPTEQRWFRVSVTPYRRGETRGAVVAHVNVTDRKLAERQLELMAATFRHADEALLICDPSFTILEVNAAYGRLIGMSHGDAVGSRPTFLDIGHQGRTVLRGLEREGQWHGELMQRNVDGRMFTSRTSVSEVRGADGSRFLVVNFEDVSALREVERQLDYLSFHDALTGLPNRRALGQWFEETTSAEPAPNLALAYLDLDHFKAVNESLGHSVGDELLRKVAQRLSDTCGDHDYVVRLGADDFVLAFSVARRSEATRRVRRLLRALAMPFESRGRRIHVSATVGISHFPDHGRKLEMLLSRADAAHAEGKRRGRGQVVLYSPAMHEAAEQKTLIEAHLYEAIDRNELRLDFQPYVRLEDGAVVGFEALARWDSPELGVVPPSRFVPVAEASGLIIKLGLWLFDAACLQVRAWLDADLDFGQLALNLSAVQFQDPDLVSQIRAAMQKHRVSGEHLRLEITESVLMSDPQRTREVLDELRSLDIRIAVDDFGTGYSSMAYLRQFPVQTIKLDQTFIKALPGSHTDASIVKSVISLASDLGMTVVAEGVETKAQRECLRRWGCQRAQGYYFSVPLNAEDVPRLLSGHPRLPREHA